MASDLVKVFRGYARESRAGFKKLVSTVAELTADLRSAKCALEEERAAREQEAAAHSQFKFRVELVLARQLYEARATLPEVREVLVDESRVNFVQTLAADFYFQNETEEQRREREAEAEKIAAAWRAAEDEVKIWR